MARFEKNLDIAYNTRLAQFWVFRSWLKAGGMLAAALLFLLLSAYTLPALTRVSAAAAGTSRLLQWSRVVVNIAGLVSAAIVAVTGFYSLLVKRPPMTGYRLMVHVAAAPVFMVAAVAIALLWAHRNRFSTTSGDTLIVLLRKLFFWAAVALLLPTVVSILVAMYPLSGPNQQQYLFLVHRRCAMAFAAALSLFGLFALPAWRKGNAL
jgi:hypothetical protein